MSLYTKETEQAARARGLAKSAEIRAMKARARRARNRSVPCPVCRAQAGGPCLKLDGSGVLLDEHAPRRA